MSASEKLKALDERATSGPWRRANASNLEGDGPIVKNLDHFDWVATVQMSNVSEWRDNAILIASLRSALPQIRAVVEEAANEHPEPHNYWNVDGTTECPMCAALAALDEALP